MLLSEETINEIIKVNKGITFPQKYGSFITKWVAFNRAYTELSTVRTGDLGQIKDLALEIADFWKDDKELRDLARELVLLECVGGREMRGEIILSPVSEVKAATIYLRNYFEQKHELGGCMYEGCRPEKQRVCNSVTVTQDKVDYFKGNEMEAILRIVYQIRCNLFHGRKTLDMSGEYGQTKRPWQLVELADEIMGRILSLLIREYSFHRGIE